MTDITSTQKPLFTPTSIYDSLQKARLIGSKRLPAKGDRQYFEAACFMNRINHLYGRNRGAALEKEQNREKIISAIQTLADLLPGTRAVYEECLVDVEKSIVISEASEERASGFRSLAQRNIAAFDALVNAVNEAMDCGIPMGDIDSLAPTIKAESDIIRTIETCISPTFPELGVGERHRFIARAVHIITGKALTEEQVRDRLRKSSTVNAGNQ